MSDGFGRKEMLRCAVCHEKTEFIVDRGVVIDFVVCTICDIRGFFLHDGKVFKRQDTVLVRALNKKMDGAR